MIYGTGTLEYPGKWVARMFVSLPVARSTRFVLCHDTLIKVRGLLPEGLARLPRSADDPPEIEEVWL